MCNTYEQLQISSHSSITDPKPACTCACIYKHTSILSPLQHIWVLDSAHSFVSMGAPSHVSPLEDVAASIALCVTTLFPRICCSPQSANPQAIEKALHQVTCTHLSCKSMPAVP